MRLCLVSPYAWDRPSEANDHIAVLARTLVDRGHEVVILAPARKATLVREGRRRLRELERGDATALRAPAGAPLVVVIGLAVPVATGGAGRSLPVPVALAASVRLAISQGRFDVIDVFDPDVLGASAAALRGSPAYTVATFVRSGPPLRTPRGAERLAARADAIAAVSNAAAATTLRRFGLQPVVTGLCVDTGRFAPASAARPALVAVEATLAGAGTLRGLVAEIAKTDVELVLMRSAGAAALRSVIPSAVADRVRLPNAATPAARAAALRGASVFVAAPNGSALIVREALAAGIPVIALRGSPAADAVRDDTNGLIVDEAQPALAGAAVGRLLADEPLRARLADGARAGTVEPAVVAGRVEALYKHPERPVRIETASDPQLRILCDFHMHTHHSHDCATPVATLVARAVTLGLGAIAVTDHNSIAGGVEAQRYAAEHGIDLHVIVGSEIKTQTGEVIGLYLTSDIPRGMAFADTVEAIRDQGGLVYVPHPFDRMHAIADEPLLRRLADQIDIFEVYNARLYREAFNRDAERFAARYDLLRAAGSDAHVVEGLGTGLVELPCFTDPESLLLALGVGRVVRRPVNLAYLQGLKWVRQARKRHGNGER
jgi:predicted metal-dependent phosphoesterase TrpH/glycosyltransferase involved in cell wall biosynthesis